MSDTEFSPPPLSNRLLSERAYEVIKSYILDGTLTPGSALVESRLARKLNVSQAPVREALRRLSHEGLVTQVPRRGSFVTEVSEGEAEQARQVRAVLEEFAAHSTSGRLGEDFQNRLVEIVEAMRLSAAADDIANFRRQDAEFHRTVVAASGNQFLVRLWQQIDASLLNLHVLSSPWWAGDRAAMAEVHATLIEALVRGDRDEAARRFGAHARGHALTAPADEAAT